MHDCRLKLICLRLACLFFLPPQLLAVFMQMGARELLMHYMDLKQTNDVQLTFEALKVRELMERTNASDWLRVTPVVLGVSSLSSFCVDVVICCCSTWRPFCCTRSLQQSLLRMGGCRSF